MLTDVGDVPVQEIRDCGVDDDRLMNVITESVKLVMEEVSFLFLCEFFINFIIGSENSRMNFLFLTNLEIKYTLCIYGCYGVSFSYLGGELKRQSII